MGLTQRATGFQVTAAVWNADLATLFSNHIQQVFRGLHLRTHPDNDVRKSKVMLVHADEIVFDAGTRINSALDRLVADITVSGAGGLDTGSEGASRWYEIYCIRKSSDGTLNLLLHRAKDYLLDQSATVATGSQGVRQAAGNTKAAETFLCGTSGPMPMFDVLIKKVGTPTGNLWASVYATSAGLPTGAAVASSDKIDVSLLPTSNQWVRLVFRNPTSLTASTTYALVLEGDYTIDGANYASWAYDGAAGYANGKFCLYNGSVWAETVGVDFAFKTYITENDTAVTMPSGYDEKCLVGHVYNDSGSDFRQFVAKGRMVFYRGSFSAGSVTATQQTLTDLSGGVPPVPTVSTWWDLYNNVAGNVQHIQSDLSNSSNAFGSVYSQAQGATTDQYPQGPAWHEFQYAYLWVSAGTGGFELRAYEW